MRSSLSAAVLGLAAGIAGCSAPLRSAGVVSSPEWALRNTKAYGETIAGLPPDVVYGWDLHVAAGVARWRECTSREACGHVARERPATDLLGFKTVGRIGSTDGSEVEVLELSLTPRPTYVVPSTKL